jgi:aryl-alcohol dehydrogenase
MEITAAVVERPDAPMVLRQLTLEAPRADEVLVRLVATGVCHTDAVMWQQAVPVPQPVVLGHEGAGIVEQVGSGVTTIKPGDHVVMSFNSCGHCPACGDGEVSYCYEFFPRNFFGTRADGSSGLSDAEGGMVHANVFGQSSFATYALCHERNAVKVPDDLPLKIAGPLGCGILTGAGAVINAFQLKAGQSFAVLGAGSVGLSAVMAAKAMGATTIVAVDLHPERLALAKELGATHTIDASTCADAAAAVLEILPVGVDFALDTTGSAKVIDQGVRMLAPRGTCGILGASAPGVSVAVELMPFMSFGRKLRGIVEGDADPKVFIPELVALYQAGRFPFDRLLTFYPFDQINEAFHDSEIGAVVKPVLVFE